MTHLFDLSVFSDFDWLSLLEVLAVAYILYRMLLLIRRTRAVPALLGVLLLLVAYYVSRLLKLDMIHWILDTIITWLPIAIIVIFQNTIRRALADFGRNPFARLRGGPELEEAVLDEVVLAATTLAAEKIGGIIVFEREQGLRTYVEAGIQLDSLVRYDLLLSIFNPRTPLHDGAVIIQENRIAAAASFLPLTSNPKLSKEFGSRHRAAIGITEESDAVAVVVSEERGSIALAEDGELKRFLTGPELRKLLLRALLHDAEAGKKA
jgi:diadenylate cyclase